jgi:phospholipase/carboxylesterase
MTSDLSYRERAAADAPEGALVLLHGRGADENDLFPLLDVLDPDRRLAGVCPRGPLALPPMGAHWYVVKRVGYPDPDTFFPTYARLSGWLDSYLADRGLTPDRTVLGGFSQGTAMAYALGLGRGRPPPAALMAFSGFIPEVDGLVIEAERAAGMPVVIAHGAVDPVIPVEFGRAARDRLIAAGAEVVYRESSIAHAIDPTVLHELSGWAPDVIQRAGDGLTA